MTAAPIWRAGEHYWRAAHADSITPLVDGAAYFAAFRAAVRQARRSLLILGWDIDSSVRLIREDVPDDGWPRELCAFLNAAVTRNRRLHARVLIWDFSMIYALEREHLPLYTFQWRTHRRLQFRMDDRHPFGASQHQKLVVVDDRVAFVGGLDLTRCRWDTPEHRADDPRRVDGGIRYAPFHDIMLRIDGDAAAALGELARERWQRATGRRLTAPAAARGPAGVGDGGDAALRDCRALIARTEPAYEGRPEVREIERLLCSAIAASRRFLYIENQYLTSSTIADALADRLADADAPDVIVVLPEKTSGWLEQSTMDVLRARLLDRLRAADRHRRLHIYAPTAPDLAGDRCIVVHSKVLIADDALLVVGSANLSNRSMGFDSECDIAVDGRDRPDLCRAIAALRDRLLGEHLDVAPDRVAAALAEHARPNDAILALSGPGRSLRRLDASVPDALKNALPDAALIDPERPLSAQLMLFALLPDSGRNNAGSAQRRARSWTRALLLLGAALALAALWRFSPLAEWLDQQRLTALLDGYRDSALAAPAMLLALIVASLVAFPITLLIVIGALTFGPLIGFALAAAGCFSGAALGYALGRWLGRGAVRRLAGRRLNRLSRQLSAQGLLTVAVVRTLPLAPFTVVNLVAGASRLRFRDYMLGTVIGMTPGMVALTAFAEAVARSVRNPSPGSIVISVAIAAAVAALAWTLQRWLRRRGAAPRGNVRAAR